MIAIYAFNGGTTLKWPLDERHHQLVQRGDPRPRRPRRLLSPRSRSESAATAIALVLGTLASFAVARHRFFGRETVSFLVVIPIALPGIVTGIALSDTFTQVLGVDLGLFTVIVAHATFCIVVVYNNVIARLRRVSANLEEASADLGAAHLADLPARHPARTCRPRWSPAALLAFALSFDEIIVTTFTLGAGQQTLPIWIFDNLFRGQQLPITNVVAVIVVLLSIIPVYLAHRLTREEGVSDAWRAAPAAAPPRAPSSSTDRGGPLRGVSPRRVGSRRPVRRPGARTGRAR